MKPRSENLDLARNMIALELPLAGFPFMCSAILEMKPIICGIYKITSPTNSIYIGQSRDILPN